MRQQSFHALRILSRPSPSRHHRLHSSRFTGCGSVPFTAFKEDRASSRGEGVERVQQSHRRINARVLPPRSRRRTSFCSSTSPFLTPPRRSADGADVIAEVSSGHGPAFTASSPQRAPGTVIGGGLQPAVVTACDLSLPISMALTVIGRHGYGIDLSPTVPQTG